MEIAVIGDEYFVTGFQTTGIKNTHVVSSENTNQVFEENMNSENIGIIITDKKTFDNLNEKLKERAMTQVKPTVVTLSHDIGGEENLRMLIKRALGIDLWNQKKEE